MNITIIQDNSRVEVLGSNGASIIEKLYELAIDPNNTLTLEGNITSTSAYGYQVDYLNTNYGPDFIVSATNRYIRFQDDAVLNVLKNSIGDGVGVFEQQLKNANPNSSLGLNGNTNIIDTRELCLIEGTDITGNFCSGCTNIKVLGIPKNVTTYSYGITENVNPEKIVIADLAKWCGVYIGSHNFNPYNDGSGIEICTLNIDGSLTVLKNITIPSNAQFLDSGWCTPFVWSNIDSVTFPATLTLIAGFGSSFVKTITFEQNSQLTKILGSTFEDCFSLAFDVSNIPQSVTTIEQRAFKRCWNATGTLNLPNIASLGYRSFYETGITSIQNLGSITSIPEECFRACASLTSIVLPQSITSIENGAFASCNNLILDVSTLPSSITTIGSEAFVNCANVTGTLNLPNLTNITGIAFRNTNITSISNLGSITTLSGGTFYGCRNLTSVQLPSTLTTINVEAFNDTAITRLLIPEGVTTIQDSSFQNCSPNISYVELPSTISNINFLFHRMFDAVSASNSVVVVIKATTPPQARYYASWAADSTNVTKCRGIYVPDASVSAYTSITDSDNPFSRSNVIAKIYPISQLQTDSPSAWQIYNRS